MSCVSILAVTFIGLIGSAGSAASDDHPKYTQQQLSARFYFDLGPDFIDVSSYPDPQKAEYEVFKRDCSQCHSLARPINSPYVTKADWGRYVTRMHLKSKQGGKHEISGSDAAAIVDFLTKDAQQRKIKDSANFSARTEELKSKFKDVEAERSRLQIEESRKKAEPSAPYTGSKAQSTP